MKKIVLTIAMLGLGLTVVLGACSLSLPEASPSDPLVMTPEEVVESFYNWYMEFPGNPLVKRDYRQSLFLAEAFVQQVDEAMDSFQGRGGFDPFLCAQDVPEKIFVQPAEITQDSAEVIVNSSFEGHSIKVDLQRVKEADWLITGIHCQ